MKIAHLFLPALLLAGNAQAAVDVNGFTVGGGSAPYGLLALIVALLFLGVRGGFFSSGK